MGLRCIGFVLAVLCWQTVVAAPKPPADPLKGLDAEIREVVKAWAVPGLAVVVVRNGKTVYLKGFGKRRLGTAQKVDGDTLFNIGSITKSFTAVALAMLAQQKKLRWNDAIVKHLTDFKVGDPYFTMHLTIRDLLSHNSGMGMQFGDRIWMTPALLNAFLTGQKPPKNAARTWAAMKTILAKTKPRHSFRETFSYSNIFYMVLGKILEKQSGKTWSAYVRDNVLTPLKMLRTTTRIPQLGKRTNVARGHFINSEGKLIANPHFIGHPLPASGSINSSARELASFMKFVLAGGSVGKRVLLKAAVLNQMLTPQSLISPRYLKVFRATYFAYGLGWWLYDYKGVKLVTSSGDGMGYTSRMVLIPSLNVGFAVLTNYDTSGPANTVRGLLADRFLGGAKTPWKAFYLKKKMPTLSFPIVRISKKELKAYVGTYQVNKRFRRVVKFRKGKLVIEPALPLGGPPIGFASLFYRGNDQFYIKTYPAIFVFERKAGMITGLTEKFAGRSWKYKKLR